MPRIQFKVHGTVQANRKHALMQARSFTQKKANSYGLTGWVKNTPNEKVEGEAQGSEEDIQKLLKDLDKGPSLAHVVNLEKSSIDEKSGENNFEIK